VTNIVTTVTNADGSITIDTVTSRIVIVPSQWIPVGVLLAVLVVVAIWFGTRKKESDSN
jgi:hypothetical protein